MGPIPGSPNKQGACAATETPQSKPGMPAASDKPGPNPVDAFSKTNVELNLIPDLNKATNPNHGSNLGGQYGQDASKEISPSSAASSGGTGKGGNSPAGNFNFDPANLSSYASASFPKLQERVIGIQENFFAEKSPYLKLPKLYGGAHASNGQMIDPRTGEVMFDPQDKPVGKAAPANPLIDMGYHIADRGFYFNFGTGAEGAQILKLDLPRNTCYPPTMAAIKFCLENGCGISSTGDGHIIINFGKSNPKQLISNLSASHDLLREALHSPMTIQAADEEFVERASGKNGIPDAEFGCHPNLMRGPSRQVTWKIHLPVQRDLNNPIARRAIEYAAENGYNFKLGHGGEFDAGKGMTFYFGNRDNLMKSIPFFVKLLENTPMPVGAEPRSTNVEVAKNVWARFDPTGTLAMRRYSFNGTGIPYLNLDDHLSDRNHPSYNQRAALLRSHKILLHEYGIYYLGSDAAWAEAYKSPIASHPDYKAYDLYLMRAASLISNTDPAKIVKDFNSSLEGATKMMPAEQRNLILRSDLATKAAFLNLYNTAHTNPEFVMYRNEAEIKEKFQELMRDHFLESEVGSEKINDKYVNQFKLGVLAEQRFQTGIDPSGLDKIQMPLIRQAINAFDMSGPENLIRRNFAYWYDEALSHTTPELWNVIEGAGPVTKAHFVECYFAALHDPIFGTVDKSESVQPQLEKTFHDFYEATKNQETFNNMRLAEFEKRAAKFSQTSDNTRLGPWAHGREGQLFNKFGEPIAELRNSRGETLDQVRWRLQHEGSDPLVKIRQNMGMKLSIRAVGGAALGTVNRAVFLRGIVSGEAFRDPVSGGMAVGGLAGDTTGLAAQHFVQETVKYQKLLEAAKKTGDAAEIAKFEGKIIQNGGRSAAFGLTAKAFGMVLGPAAGVSEIDASLQMNSPVSRGSHMLLGMGFLAEAPLAAAGLGGPLAPFLIVGSAGVALADPFLEAWHDIDESNGKMMGAGTRRIYLGHEAGVDASRLMPDTSEYRQLSKLQGELSGVPKDPESLRLAIQSKMENSTSDLRVMQYKEALKELGAGAPGETFAYQQEDLNGEIREETCSTYASRYNAAVKLRALDGERSQKLESCIQSVMATSPGISGPPSAKILGEEISKENLSTRKEFEKLTRMSSDERKSYLEENAKFLKEAGIPRHSALSGSLLTYDNLPEKAASIGMTLEQIGLKNEMPHVKIAAEQYEKEVLERLKANGRPSDADQMALVHLAIQKESRHDPLENLALQVKEIRMNHYINRRRAGDQLFIINPREGFGNPMDLFKKIGSLNQIKR